MPFFGYSDLLLQPCDDLHGREDHKEQHHYAEDKCQDNIDHTSYPVIAVQKSILFLLFERYALERGAGIIADDQGMVFKAEMLLTPLFFQRFKAVEELPVVGLLFEILIRFAAYLQAAEALLHIVGAVLSDDLVDAGIFGSGSALHEGGDAKEQKTDREQNKKRFFHKCGSLLDRYPVSIDSFD